MGSTARLLPRVASTGATRVGPTHEWHLYASQFERAASRLRKGRVLQRLFVLATRYFRLECVLQAGTSLPNAEGRLALCYLSRRRPGQHSAQRNQDSGPPKSRCRSLPRYRRASFFRNRFEGIDHSSIRVGAQIPTLRPRLGV